MVWKTSRQPWMIWYAVLLHILYGVCLMIWPDTRVLALLGGFKHILDIIGPLATGILLTLVAAVATLGLIFDRRINVWLSTACLMPQYLILVLAFISGLESLYEGIHTRSQSTGQMIDVARPLILIGVGPICIAAVLHTFSIIDRLASRRNGHQESLDSLRMRILELEKERVRNSF